MEETAKGEGEYRRFLSPDSPARESFEDLAGTLLSLEGVRSVVVTGTEPEAGCSSVCLGLGSALAASGFRAAVVDCNLGRPRLHHMLGEPNFVGLTSALSGEKPLEHCGNEPVPRLLVVPTGPVPANPAAVFENERFVEAVRALEEGRELVILDAPAVEELLDIPALSGGFDGAMLVVHASRTVKRDARAATDDLLGAEVNLLGVALNGIG